MTEQQDVVISQRLAVQLKRLLEVFSNPMTYTHRPRIGGVVQGCPRGPQVTPEKLAINVSFVRDMYLEEVLPQWRKR